MNFGSFVGNEELKETLNNAFISGRLPHAVILQGDDGLGKHTLAELIARAAVCRKDPLTAPCGNCPSCIRAMAGSHPDIRVIEGTGASGMISVDSVRGLTSDAYRMPEEADVNVYILHGGNQMSKIVQNKLLKIIEEPPEGTLFIITIKSADTLLPTIISRAKIFTLRPLKKQEAVGFAVNQLGTDTEKALEAYGVFGGNAGRIKNYIEGSEDARSYLIASDIAGLLNSRDEHSLMAAMAPMLKDRKLFAAVAENLGIILRDACVLREGSENSIGSDFENSKKLSQALTKSRLMLLPEICFSYAAYSRRNANMTLLVTSFCGKLRSTVLK